MTSSEDRRISRARSAVPREAEGVSEEIRQATIDDAPALADLHVRCWQEAYAGQLPQPYLDGLTAEGRLGMWRSLLSDEWPADALVAVDGADLIAFVAVGQETDPASDPGSGIVYSIYARQRAWGTGVGRSLMDRGLRALRERGCYEASLWVLETNDRARRFYEVGGWIVDGSRIEDIGGESVRELRYRISL